MSVGDGAHGGDGASLSAVELAFGYLSGEVGVEKVGWTFIS